MGFTAGYPTMPDVNYYEGYGWGWMTGEPEEKEEAPPSFEENVKSWLSDAFKTTPVQSTMNILEELDDIMETSLSDLATVSQIHSLSELTGSLSSEQSALLDRIRTNSIANLSEVVNEETEDLVKSKIADLTSRGVLSGNVGTQALQDIDEYRTKKLVQGTRDIETNLAGLELNLIESNKEKQMELWGQELTKDLETAKLTTGWETAKLGTKGELASTMLGAQSDWDIARLNALTNIYGADTSGRYDLQVAGMQSKAADTASKWGAIGSIGGAIAGIFSSRKLKDNITPLENVLEKLNLIRGVSFDWKNGDGHDVGVIAEELQDAIPEAVIEIDGINRVYYHKIIPLLVEAIKEQQKQIDELKGGKS